ncbi:hypothetical protein PoB_000583100 [Plakobranchus ocellatus]|uniref:CUB domain-containing protein n=1 Tax=Plakobranchus ocellatus TaxID=259542 RepID=A0AAV3XWG6_9GAST|nr:hypothetical protein PoB_000583100 [Plakobranchus ocellatus]
MVFHIVFKYICCLALFILFDGGFSQNVCPYFEEGSFQTLSCQLENKPFRVLGMHIEINGQEYATGSCDNQGRCSVADSSRYQVRFSYDRRRNKRIFDLYVNHINRTATKFLCYEDGIPIPGAWCKLQVYVKASKPTCEGPRFVGDNTSALITCTSERVYPGGTCDFKVKELSLLASQYMFWTLTKTETPSDQFSGDKQITCQLRIHLERVPEGTYTFQVVMAPDLLQLTESALTYGDELPPLRLSAMALLFPSDNNRVLTYDASGQLRVDVSVTGNPPPNYISLTVRHDETSAPVPVTARDYSVVYSATAGDAKGRITLEVTRVWDECANSYFTMEASNGVVGNMPFQYNFTMLRKYTTPSKPNCDGAKFVDGNTAFVITCTSERVFPIGKCNFTYTGESSLTLAPVQTTNNVDSNKFPGHKELTCKLRVPVTGNTEVNFKYEVEVTPDLNQVPACATVDGHPLPAMSLKATALYDPEENDLVFDYPESGELELDIQVIGNPEPNRVSLHMRQDETSAMVSLSSRDYRWEYDRTAGAIGGVLKLFITGGLRKDVSTEYILNAENGVLGQDEFEYKFSVGDEVTEGNSGDNILLIVGISAGGVIVVLILAIIVVVVLRGRRPHDEGYDTAVPSGYLYPDTAYHPAHLAPNPRRPYQSDYCDGWSNIYAEPYVD